MRTDPLPFIPLQTPLTRATVSQLCAGDRIQLTGTLYTARDAAHKRLCESIDRDEPLPFELRDAVIYYVGPTPARPGQVIGSCGPTTASRMDAYAPALLDRGLRGMIGKGFRSPEVIDAIVRNGAVYFGAIGGAGALLARCVVQSEIVAYEDLGAEAIRRLKVIDFPATVIVDAHGQNLYTLGPRAYRESI